MLIWSRWGFLVVLAMGAGALCGFGLRALVAPGAPDSGPVANIFGGVGVLLAGVFTWMLAHLLIGPRLDKPRPLTVMQQLPQPFVNERGAQQTHRQVNVTHPETGEQLYSQPRSTLFFIPVAVWAYILGVIGAVILFIGVVTAILR